MVRSPQATIRGALPSQCGLTVFIIPGCSIGAMLSAKKAKSYITFPKFMFCVRATPAPETKRLGNAAVLMLFQFENSTLVWMTKNKDIWKQ